MSDRILVTGGAGFLGSHLVRRVLGAPDARVVNLDLLTYAGSLARLDDVATDDRYRFVQGDVADPSAVETVLDGFRPEIVAHFAAESHVTRSEADPDVFHRTNVEGTRVMLTAAANAGVRRFIHISTDEVYGPILDGAFAEEDKGPGEGEATSPYARSKALADDLASSFQSTMEIIVVRPTNAFGPWQYPEKAFPRWTIRALEGRPLLVWGDGLYVRQWLYADDLAEAVMLLIAADEPERIYNVGPRHEPEITNLDLVRWLVGHLELPGDLITHTAYDRPDHDRRYAVDPSRIEALGWKPGDTWAQLADTVDWYRHHRSWWEGLVSEAESIYQDEA